MPRRVVARLQLERRLEKTHLARRRLGHQPLDVALEHGERAVIRGRRSGARQPGAGASRRASRSNTPEEIA